MNGKSLAVEFVNPYYASVIRDYVAVQYPTGEVVRLWEDGELLAEAADPRDRWARLLADLAQEKGISLTEGDVEQAGTFESFEELPCRP